MNKKEFLKNIEATYREGLELVEKKNADYASADNPFQNFNNSQMVGVSVEKAILVRMVDKISRIANLLDGDRMVKEEKLTDSILDLINYGAILRAYLNNKTVI